MHHRKQNWNIKIKTRWFTNHSADIHARDTRAFNQIILYEGFGCWSSNKANVCHHIRHGKPFRFRHNRRFGDIINVINCHQPPPPPPPSTTTTTRNRSECNIMDSCYSLTCYQCCSHVLYLPQECQTVVPSSRHVPLDSAESK